VRAGGGGYLMLNRRNVLIAMAGAIVMPAISSNASDTVLPTTASAAQPKLMAGEQLMYSTLRLVLLMRVLAPCKLSRSPLKAREPTCYNIVTWGYMLKFNTLSPRGPSQHLFVLGGRRETDRIALAADRVRCRCARRDRQCIYTERANTTCGDWSDSDPY